MKRWREKFEKREDPPLSDRHLPELEFEPKALGLLNLLYPWAMPLASLWAYPSVLKSHQASLAQMPAQFTETQISFASLMQYLNCCRFSVLLCTISMPAWVQSASIYQCLAETGPVPSQIEKPGQQLDHFPLQIPQGQPVRQTFSLYLIPKHCSGKAFPVSEERLGLKMSNGNRTPLWPLLTTSTQEEPEGRDTI